MKKELFRIYNLTLSQQQIPLLTNLYLQVFENEHTGILFNSFKERDIFADFLANLSGYATLWFYELGCSRPQGVCGDS